MKSLNASSRGEELAQQIKGWTKPPVFLDDENKTRRARLLNLALLNVLVLMPVLIISNFLGGNTSAAVIWIDILVFVACLVFRHWMRLGRIGLASSGLMALGFIGITAGVASLGTIRVPVTAMYLLLVITAGLLFELRGMIVTTAICSLLVAGLIIGENMSLLPVPNYSVTITQWITYTAIFGWAGSLLYSALQSMHNALNLAEVEIKERKRAELELEKHRDNLKELIKEGNAELGAKNAVLSKEITERKQIEEALRTEKDRAERYLNIAEVIIVALDTDAKITLLNRKGLQVLGYEEGELIGRDWIHTCLHPKEHQRIHDINRKINAGEIEAFEYYENYVLTKTGEERFIAWHTTVLGDENGRIIGTLSSGEDITERKTAEKRIIESEEKYRLLVEDSLMGIGMSQGNKVIFANPALLHIFGYDNLEEFIKIPLLDHIAPESKDMISTRMREIGEGRPVPSEFEYTIMRKDGTARILMATSSRVTLGGEIYTQTTFQDITEQKQTEEALQESENMYRAIFENTGTSTMIIEDNTIVSLANSELEKFTGYSREEIEGKMSWTEFVIKEDLDRMLEQHRLRRIYPEAALNSYEFRAFDKKGNVKDIILRVGVINGTKKSIASLLDITERKKMEEALEASYQILNGIINAIPIRVFWKDRDLNFLGCNTIFAQDAGFADPKDIVGKDDYQMVWHDQADSYRADDRQVIESGLPKLLIEEPQTTPDGGTIVLLTSKIPLRNSDGRIIGVIGTYMDITERKKTEDALRESKDYLNKIIDSIGDPLFVKDRQHRMTLVNDAACELWGRPRDEILGRTSYDLFPSKEMADISWMKDEEVFNTGIEITNEETNTYAPGVTRTVLVKKTPYTDKAGNKFLVGITRDITERKQAENRIIASLQEKEILLKEIHHRVKNNLQVISALLYLQSSSITDGNIIKVFKDSQDRIKSMALIHENLYKSDSFGKVNFNEYINQLISYLSQSYGDNSRKIRFKMKSGNIFLNINTAIPCGMIINELVSNSLKHAFPDGRNGEICIDLSSEDGGFKLIVSDNGVGIKGDIDAKDSKTLGFRLIYALIKQIDGRMNLDAINGTKFEIHFKGLE